jgi:uncharacterized membrane protein HdeD (DUF308 family)
MLKKIIEKYKKKYSKIKPRNKKIIGIIMIIFGVTQFINPFVSGLCIIAVGSRLIIDSRK